MKESTPATVKEYIAKLPEERREAIKKVRGIILKNLPAGYVETFLYRMISYVVPLERYPKTYNGQPLTLASLGSQKNYMVLHLLCAYEDSATARWFTSEYKKTGKRLDMGKACVRFRTLEDLPLDLVGRMIARVPVDKYITIYEKARATSGSRSSRPKKSPAKARRPGGARA